jgi:hypothetical protein
MRIRYRRNGKPQSYDPEYLQTLPRSLPQPLAGPFEQCTGCPYPSHGFLCWDNQSTCLRDQMRKFENRDRKVEF